jgi:predicted ester cyclase
MRLDENRRLIHRYYEELWNTWNFGLTEEIISSDIRFRGSLGVEVRGLQGFVGYMHKVQNAFPDFSNKIEELISEGDRIAARLTYTGTHKGELFGLAPTGTRATYSGAAIFKVLDGKIADGWVLGDVYNLIAQLNAKQAK